MNFTVPQDPFRDHAESDVTSVVMDLRDAYDFTVSIRTTSATTTTASTVTFQASNWTGRWLLDGDPPEATWSTTTAFEIPSGGTIVQHPLGMRYARVLRTPSAQSMQMFENKHVR